MDGGVWLSIVILFELLDNDNLLFVVCLVTRRLSPSQFPRRKVVWSLVVNSHCRKNLILFSKWLWQFPFDLELLVVCRGWSKVNMAFLLLGVGGFLSHQGYLIGRGSWKIIDYK